ncbi:MAG: LysR family transcriptional regulator [Clostridia bacterium]|nr:LysR family transcriptional regulator [Clostridia bacterium]
MKLEHFYYLVAINDSGSLNKAAANLFISQPYLSAVIRELEHELGYKLMNRSNRGITLTEEGKIVLDHGKSILKHIDDIKAISASLQAKVATLIIVGFTSYLLLDVYQDFLSLSRPSKWYLNYEEKQNPMVYEKVLSGECHVGLMYLDTKHLDDYRHYFDKKNLKFVSLIRSPIYAIVSKHHPMASETKVTLSQLKLYPLLIESFKMNYSPINKIQNVLESEFSGFTLEPNRFDNNRSLLYYLSKSSTAFSLGQYLFNTSNPLVQNGDLIYIPITDLNTDLTTGYLTKKDFPENDLFTNYINYLNERLKKTI